MTENGFKETEDVNLTLELTQNYYGFEFTKSWTTSVNIFTQNQLPIVMTFILPQSQTERLTFAKDVYQYPDGCLSELPDHMRNGETIHFDEYLQEDLRHEFDEAIYAVYADYREDMRDEAREQLERENKLK